LTVAKKDVWGVVMRLTVVAGEIYFDWLLFVFEDIAIED
jgi:hypothetical protein